MTEHGIDDRTAVTVTARGLIAGEASREYGHYDDLLEQKRVRKRAVKLAAYAVFRGETGVQPPWGALTGIRPTRLVYQQMERGIPLDEALAWMRDQFDVTPDKLRLLHDIIEAQSELPPPKPDPACTSSGSSVKVPTTA